MDELIHAVVKSYGIIGLFMLSPLIAVVYLWKENTKLHEEIREIQAENAKKQDEMGQRVVATQDKRIEDSHHITQQLIAMTAEQASQARETTTALDRVGDMVSMMLAQVNHSSYTPRKDKAGSGS